MFGMAFPGDKLAGRGTCRTFFVIIIDPLIFQPGKPLKHRQKNMQTGCYIKLE